MNKSNKNSNLDKMRIRKYKSVDTSKLSDTELMKHFEQSLNKFYVLRIKDSKEWITCQISNSTDKNKANKFYSFADAIEYQIKLRKSEYIDTVLWESY